MRTPGLARRDDPETSHDAAESIDATNLIEKMYRVMERYGDRGCTSDDVGRHLPGIGVQTYSPRFRQMLDRGMIECTGEKRKGDSGRMQLVRRCLPPPFQPVLTMTGRRSSGDRLKQMIKDVEALPRYGGMLQASGQFSHRTYVNACGLVSLDAVLAILKGTGNRGSMSNGDP